MASCCNTTTFCCIAPPAFYRGPQALEMGSTQASKIKVARKSPGVIPNHAIGVYDEDLRNENRESWNVYLVRDGEASQPSQTKTDAL
mmetsp:Transcript_11292/g.35793  ORF Transcript_11292/g.35793 Transcript_11292/m.35793 type:complete len:87 (-) Transcript_11292:256-516(-)